MTKRKPDVRAGSGLASRPTLVSTSFRMTPARRARVEAVANALGQDLSGTMNLLLTLGIAPLERLVSRLGEEVNISASKLIWMLEGEKKNGT